MFDRILNTRLLNASQIPYWDKLGRGVGDQIRFCRFFHRQSSAALFANNECSLSRQKRKKKKTIQK